MGVGKYFSYLTIKFNLVTFINIMNNSIVSNLLYITSSSCLLRDLRQQYLIRVVSLWLYSRILESVSTDCSDGVLITKLEKEKMIPQSRIIIINI